MSGVQQRLKQSMQHSATRLLLQRYPHLSVLNPLSVLVSKGQVQASTGCDAL